MSKEKELQEQISELANKQLRREQLLEQRIKNLEQEIKENTINARLTNLEAFKTLVIIVVVGISIYKMFA